MTVERGFAWVHVSQIPTEDLTRERLCVLRRIAEAFVNVRFPKFTPSGASFLVDEGDAERVERALNATGDRFTVRRGRCVVSIHATSIREEEGTAARLVGRLAESGAPIEHLADTHDRLIAIVETRHVDRVTQALDVFVTRSDRVEPKRVRRNRRVKVMKFGGTSVATVQAREVAARKVLAAVEAGVRPVVVVSAIGRDGLPYATDTLIRQAREASPDREPDPRDLDLMLSCGEILSAVIFAETLRTVGLPTHAFRGDRAGILTDGAFGRARIVGVQPGRLEESLREGSVPVVCGFQGCVGPKEGGTCGDITTLGRGGSDTTAAALGAALGAEAVEIYTDVDGVMSADPRMVSWAKPLWKSSYGEIAALAHLGAKVLHPRAVEIAMAYGVPLWVKNTFSDERGTEIVPEEDCGRPRRTGVTHQAGLVYLRFDLRDLPEEGRAPVEGRLFGKLSSGNVPVLMVDLSPTSAGLAVPMAAYASVERIFDDLGVPISVARACTLVSLVGREYVRTPGTLQRCLQALAESGVETIQTNAVDPSISFLVAEADTATAVRCLFDYHESMNGD